MDKSQSSITGFLSGGLQIILNKENNTIFHTSKHLFGSKKIFFDPAVKQDIIARINKLTPQSKALWGKMNAGQMLAYLQVPIGVGLGTNKIPRTFIGRIFGPFAKKILYNDKPFKRHLPTDPSFLMKEEKDFEKEKQGLINMVTKFPENSLVEQPHPFFGKLTKEQWSNGNI